MNFLAELYEQGYQYLSINSYRSAISSVHEKVDGYQIGKHLMVSRMLQGVFNSRPPQPRYKSTWKVSTVLDWISNETTSNKSLLFLSMKLTTLLALSRPCRSADLAGLQLSHLKFTPEGATFMASHLAGIYTSNKVVQKG